MKVYSTTIIFTLALTASLSLAAPTPWKGLEIFSSSKNQENNQSQQNNGRSVQIVGDSAFQEQYRPAQTGERRVIISPGPSQRQNSIEALFDAARSGPRQPPTQQ
jgi:hypothetical protein